MTQEEAPVGRLVIAHLNHQLRGPESDADEMFVRDWVARMRLDFPGDLRLHCDRKEVASLARVKRQNLESFGRRLRYTWLAEVAVQEGINLVVTGHTADDQAETVLHHILRGTGLRGLRGIAPCQKLEPGVRLVRPMLDVSRGEIVRYLEQEGQSYRQDSSNRDLRYTRNRIRHELLPQLAEHYSPRIVPNLCRLAMGARELFAIREAEAAALLARAELARCGPVVVLNRLLLGKTPRPRLREMFRLLWRRECWPEGQMDFDAWNRLAGLVFGEGSALDLPAGIHARCRERVVQLGRRP